MLFSVWHFPILLLPSLTVLCLQVCREFQRGTCSRQPSECRYAHPPDNVTVDCSDNQITVCMDFVKGKCTRESCKYFHPPPHLQAQIKAAQQRANTTAAQALVGFPIQLCTKELSTGQTKKNKKNLMIKEISIKIADICRLLNLFCQIDLKYKIKLYCL